MCTRAPRGGKEGGAYLEFGGRLKGIRRRRRRQLEDGGTQRVSPNVHSDAAANGCGRLEPRAALATVGKGCERLQSKYGRGVDLAPAVLVPPSPEQHAAREQHEDPVGHRPFVIDGGVATPALHAPHAHNPHERLVGKVTKRTQLTKRARSDAGGTHHLDLAAVAIGELAGERAFSTMESSQLGAVLCLAQHAGSRA